MMHADRSIQGASTVLLLVAGAMAVAFLALWWLSSRPEGPLRRIDRGPVAAVERAAATASAPREGFVTPEAVERFVLARSMQVTAQDPFLSAGEEQWKRFLADLRERPPRLEGIVVVEGARVALIQGSRYRVGDDVGPYRVLTIEDRAVQLSKEGRIFTIHLTPAKEEGP